MSSNDNNQKNLIDKALDFHKNGKIDDALNLYLELIKNEENNPQLLFLLGTACVQTKKTIVFFVCTQAVPNKNKS